MGRWRRICCPVDFSPVSRAALAEAVSLAASLAAELLLLHVRQAATSPGGVPFMPPARGAPAGASTELQEWAAEAQRSAPTTATELGGEPAAEIVRFVAELGCDLIVMGTHGRTGLRHLALGSVAEAVIRAAPCPVLIVRRPTPPA